MPVDVTGGLVSPCWQRVVAMRRPSLLPPGEQHRAQRLPDVQRLAHPPLCGGRLLRRGHGALQAVHVRRRHPVPPAGQVLKHGLPDLRQSLRPLGSAPPQSPAVGARKKKNTRQNGPMSLSLTVQ